MTSLCSRLAISCAIGSLACIVFGQTVDNSPPVKQEVLDQVASILSKNAFVPGVDFSKWPDFIKSEKPQIDASNNDEEFQRAVNSALKKFGASHTVLNSPRVAELRQTGAMVGVGISTRPVPEGLLVTRCIDDAPAIRGGIIPGDIITMVDGKPAKSAAGIEGREGSDVTLTVQHIDKTSEDYILTRRKFSTVRPEELHWKDKNTVLLAVNTFGFSYDRQRVADFMKEAQESQNLILDLRDNGGGEIGNLRHLLGFLVPMDKPIGTFIDRAIVDGFVSVTHGNPTDLAAIAAWTKRKVRPIPEPDIPVYKGRIVVLINGLSGSASEILAQGLHDVLGSTIVGTKSAGAVLVSLYVGASNGFMLQFPLSDYVTIKGVRLEGMGVTPNTVVNEPLIHSPTTPDPVIDKALEILSKMDHSVSTASTG